LLLLKAMAFPGLLMMLAFGAVVHVELHIHRACARRGEASRGTNRLKIAKVSEWSRFSEDVLSLTSREAACREAGWNSKQEAKTLG
jgi:hypothetical protein